MKKSIIISFALFLSCVGEDYSPRVGDIVLQDLKGPSSEAIKIATASQYSHCGIITIEDGKHFVIEAVGPVRKIPMDIWIANGGEHYTALRLKDERKLGGVIDAAEKYLGLAYDHLYEWDDEKFYCSELVYKAYIEGSGIELCPLRPFEEYDIEPIYRAIVKRYGRVPEGMMVVAPKDLAVSNLLKIVYSNMRK